MPVVAIVANTAWNIWNYRLSLIRALVANGYEVVCIAPPDRHAAKLTAIAHVRFLPLRHLDRRSFSLFKNFRLFFELFFLLRREKPGVVFLFTVKPNVLGNFAAALARVRTISTIEGLGASGTVLARYKRWLLWLFRLAFRFARYVVFLNRDDRSEFLRAGLVTPAKVVSIPGPGVDADYFAPEKNSIENKAPVFLFMGRLLAEKGIHQFVEAAFLVNNSGTKATFQILGSIDPGNPSSLSTETLEALCNKGVVDHLGRRDDVRAVLAAADVLVLPSYYREGVPRSVLEAMSMGKAIITTDNPGCRDTVEAGQNGYLVPPENAEALAQACLNYIRLSASERTAMGMRSREKILTEFADKHVLDILLPLVSDCLD